MNSVSMICLEVLLDYHVLSILIKHESCLFVHVFRSHQKTQGHDILAQGLIWANLKHDEAQFLRGRVPIWSCVKISHLVVHANFRHLRTLAHENLALGLFVGPF